MRWQGRHAKQLWPRLSRLWWNCRDFLFHFVVFSLALLVIGVLVFAYLAQDVFRDVAPRIDSATARVLTAYRHGGESALYATAEQLMQQPRQFPANREDGIAHAGDERRRVWRHQQHARDFPPPPFVDADNPGFVVVRSAGHSREEHDADDFDSLFALLNSSEAKDRDNFLYVPLVDYRSNQEANRSEDSRWVYEFFIEWGDAYGLFRLCLRDVDGRHFCKRTNALGRTILLPDNSIVAVLAPDTIPDLWNGLPLLPLLLLALFGAWLTTRSNAQALATISLGLASRQTITSQGGGGQQYRLVIPHAHQRLQSVVEQINHVLTDMGEANRRTREQSDRIAHDLRTPLNSLIHTLEAMRDDMGTSNHAHLAALEGALARVHGLRRGFDGILRLTRMQGGGMRPSVTEVDLTGLVAELVEVYASAAEQADLQLECVSQARLVGAVDASLVQLAISNLLDNALRYARSSVSVHVLPLDTATGQVRCGVTITVWDDGEGINPALWDEVFAPFWRADTARAITDGVHLGIGLSLVSSVARLHGGEAYPLQDSESRFGIRIVLPISTEAY